MLNIADDILKRFILDGSIDLLKGKPDVLFRDEREGHQLPYKLVDIISFPVGNLKHSFT